jgi:hypothetical protein
VQGAQADGESWLERARRGLDAARILAEAAPDSSIVLAYDAARQACVALLAQQGLRPTTSGGHYAIEEAIRVQFGASLRTFGGPSADCAAGGMSLSIRSTRQKEPAPTRPPKRSQPSARSSTQSRGFSLTSGSSERAVNARTSS